MLRQIIQEKFPLRNAPKARHLMIGEANHESGNHVEFLSEIRQRTKRIDLLNNAADTEQARDFPEHGHAVYVEANSGMTKELRDVKKVSCAAAQIENALGTRHVEFKLANPANVNSNPAVEIQVFGPVRAGICHGILPANVFELYRIYFLDDAFCLQREAIRAQHPEGTFSRASQTLAVDQFSYFMAKLHSSHLVAK